MTDFLKSFYVSLVVFRSRIHYRLRHLLKTFTLKGVKLSIDDDTVLSKDILLSVLQGGYEDKEYKVIKENLEASDIVLELGACIGFNSIAAAKINGGRLVAYEANPDLIPLLKHNQELNHVSFEIRNKILISDESLPPTIEFKIAANPCMSSVKDYKMPGHVVKETTQVETEYTGDVLNSLSPTFLIVDIEGGEEEFFSRPGVFARSTVKKILLDISPDVIGVEACNVVIRNIMNAGFDMVTESCTGSVLFFRKRESRFQVS